MSEVSAQVSEVSTATPPATGTTESVEAPQASPAPAENQAGTNQLSPPPSQEPQKESREELNFSARFAALTRKEKDLLRQQQEIKQQREDPSWQAYQAGIKERNVIKVIQALGFKDLHEAAEYVVSDGKETPEQRLARLEKTLDDDKKAKEALAAEEQKQYIEDTISEHKRAIAAHIDTSGDNYELIKLNGAQDEVFELIQEHWEKTEEVLTIEAACQMVEKFFEEQAQKLLSAKKLSSRLKVSTAPTAQDMPAVTDEPTQTQPGSKTLTNASVIAAPSKPSQWLSDEESKAAAAEFLRKALAEKRA